MPRRKPRANSLAARIGAVETRSWENTTQIIRRLGIEVTWAKIADVMISGQGVESSNFVTGSAGWRIDGAGNTEFQSATIRGSLNADDITAGTLNVARIGAGTITASKIASNTITASEISASAIDTSELAAGAVTASKIEAGTITASQIATNTITAGQIAAGAIDTSELAADAVNASKIASNTITASEIASNTITASKIASNTITASEIASNTITASKIASNTITATELAANSVTATEINVSTLSAISANIGTITAGSITGVTITGGTIRTASSGERVELNSTNKNRVQWYGSSGALGQLIGSGSGMQWLTNVFSISNSAGTTLFISGSSTEILISPPLALDQGLNMQTTDIVNVGEIRVRNGSVSNPSLTFTNSLSSGLYLITGNYVGMAAGGVILSQWGYSGSNKNIYLYGLPSTATNYVRYNGSTGELGYSSSTRRIKKNERPAPLGVTDLLRPVRFQYRRDDEITDKRFRIAEEDWDTEQVGFIAEDVAEVLPEAAIYNDDDSIPVNFEPSAVLAVVVADLQDARRRIEELETKLAA